MSRGALRRAVSGAWPRAVAAPLLAIAAPLLAIVAALLAGALLILAAGHDPLAAYAALARGAAGGRAAANLAATLGRAVPIVGLGLAAALAFRAGFFNLGGEGQLVLGGLAATVTALSLPLPSPWLAPAAIAAGMLAGGLWAWSAAFCQARWGVPMLVSTLLLNYPARALASWSVNHPLRDVASSMSQSPPVPAAARLEPLLSALRLGVGDLAIAALVLLLGLGLARSELGYRIRLAGANPRLLVHAGVDVDGLGQAVMFASGALAGLVGAIEVLEVHRRFIDGALTQPLYAWTGLMAALLAASRPLGVLAAGLFFAALQTGAAGMERDTAVPREISLVLQALVILFVATAGRRRAAEEEEA